MIFPFRDSMTSFKNPIFKSCIALLAVIVLSLNSCNESGNNTAPIVQDTTHLMISGNVVKAPIQGAMVTFFPLNGNGSIGAPELGEAVTDNNGAFVFNLRPAPTKPFLAVTNGGFYVDEVTGIRINLNAGESLTAAIPAGTTRATITPLTHMAAERARILAAGGTPLAIAVNSSNAGVAQQYGLQDILGIIPGAASDATQMQIASREARNYSLVLAGIAQEANALNVRAIDLAIALAIDMRDGVLNGRDNTTAIVIPTNSGGALGLTATMGTRDLQLAIDAFAGAIINRTNIVAFNITSTSLQIGVNTSGALYITSTVLPVWTSGQGGSAQLTATGGTPPYACSLKTGSLPAGFSLAPANCMILGTAPLLGAGITMSISAPFTITITDAGVPAVSADLDLRITIVAPKPTLIPVAGVMTVNVPGATQVARDTGGTPPLYFAHDSFAYGAHPLGTVMDQNGFLVGTPNQVGVFNFQVCVIDKVGAEDCKMTSVTVNPAARVYNLTVNKIGNSTGTVSSSPAGINCGGTCSAPFPGDTVVTLTAVPDSGATFAGWSGACSGTSSCNIRMDSAKTVRAAFSLVSVLLDTLKVIRAGTGTGNVTSYPSGIDCKAGYCSNTFANGTSVNLTATPDSGSFFVGWTGACSGSGACNVFLDSTKTVIATFTSSPPCNYTYSAWSACQPDSTQSRSVASSSPPGCTGLPALQQSCVYTPNTDCCDCNFDVYCTIFGQGGCWYCRNSTIVSGTCVAPSGHLTSPGLCVCDPGLYQQCL